MANPYTPPKSTLEREETSHGADADGSDKKLQGLGGWLILVGLGVVLSPLRLAISLVAIYKPIFEDGSWEALTTVGADAYHPLWAPVIAGELCFNTGIVVLSLYLIYLFFSKHYLFPRFYIGIVLASLVFIPLDVWVVGFILPDGPMLDQQTTKDFMRTLIGVLIWVPYLLVSKRVRATFVERKPNHRKYAER